VTKLKAFLAEYELPRDPGASYEYSNLGFGLLGYALAQSAHTTYGALTDDVILKPLGMTMDRHRVQRRNARPPRCRS
jgi:D-alanyl-D-alanine-carboxypeptidase/D-alanyl-D-alanine-endopeptidase